MASTERKAESGKRKAEKPTASIAGSTRATPSPLNGERVGVRGENVSKVSKSRFVGVALRRLRFCALCLCCSFILSLPLAAVDSFWSFAVQPEPLRVIIETDLGGDPDDEQSMVRFLLYTCEWDVEGIIANRPVTRRPENYHPQDTGLGIARALVHAYGACYTNLIRHDSRYPEPSQLLARTVAGYDDVEDGVNLIVAAVDRKDPRPIWYADWGSDRGSAVVNLRRALDKVWRERGPDGYARFKNKLRIIGYDQYAEHTSRPPAWRFWVNTFQPPQDGKRWYHRFSALTAKAGGFNLARDVLTGHGPLGAAYPTNTTHWQKEGDTATFLYLVPTGMNDPLEPTWGSWAGRYGTNENFPGKPFFWANQVDAWRGTTNRDNTLARWAADLQNDFRARLDWCVRGPTDPNHAPWVRLNGVGGNAVLQFHAPVGQELRLSAERSLDPDDHRVRYEWWIYREAGTYRGPAHLESETLIRDGIAVVQGPEARLIMPHDAVGKTIHVIVAGTDSGQPPLTRYRRAVITGSDPTEAARILQPFYQPPAQFIDQFGDYRSPLFFADEKAGSAKTPTDWGRRRTEILQQWQELMGQWPPMLEQPKREVLSSEQRRDNFWQDRVRVEIAPGQTGEGWLLTPVGARGRRLPAVLVVYYEPETSVGLNPDQPLRDFGLQLARRGFVTLSIGTPGGNAWKPDVGQAVCQPLSYHAYVAANMWQVLAKLPYVDSTRIGVVGHSYGGKWAMFAGALWDKFAAVAVSDPGIVFDETRPNVNYWEPWYLGLDPAEKRPKAGIPGPDNPRTGAYRRMKETGRDLHELHALIAPRPFFVSGGAEDPPARWLALNHLVAIDRLLGYTNRVAMTSRAEHTPNEESNAQLYAFFEHFLGSRAER